ncbi:MAG: hypothetical protein L0216_18565 [Planctomycetales bacterium]|nr:hypothetical protein [Planctomycetales bacterium]
MTEGQRSRFKRPVRLWPFVEVDRFDRDVLGTDPSDPDLLRMTDVDVLSPLAGYHDEERLAERARQAGEPPERSGYSWLFPLLWSFWDRDSSSTFLVPLGGVTKGKDRWRAYLFPLAGTAASGPDGWDASLLWPLLSFGSGGGSWWARAAPLLWFGGGPWGSRAAALPLFWYESSTAKDTAAFVSPLVVRAEGRDWKWTSVTPLVHSWRADDRGTDLVLPFYLRRFGPDYDLLVNPLFVHARDRESSYTSVTPLYHRWRKRGSGFDLAAPVFLSAFTPRSDLLVVLPIGARWRHKTDGALDLVGPFWDFATAGGEARYWGIFPLLWSLRDDRRDFSSFTVFPLYHEARDGRKGKRSRILLPLLVDSESPTERLLWIAPLNGYLLDKRTGEETTVALPFLVRRAESSAGPWTTLVNPLYLGWRNSEGAAFDLVAGLFWRYAEGERLERWFSLPGIYHERAGDRTTDLVFPIWFSRRSGATSTTVAPFWFSHDDPERSIRYVFPFYGRATRGTRTRTHLLFPLLSWETDEKEGLTSVDALWPLVGWSDEGGRRVSRALPFFYSSRERETGDGVDFVLPSWLAVKHGETRYSHLLPIYAHRRGASGLWWTSVLGPLVIAGGNEKEGRFFLEAPFPLVHYGERGDRYDWRALPLAFGDGGPEGARTVVLPFLFRQRRGEETDTLLLPLFASRRRGAASETIAPLWWSRDAPGVRERVLFPLWWDLEGPRGSSTHLWPLYGRDEWKDETGRTTFLRRSILFPLFRWWEDPVRGTSGVDAPWPLVATQTSKDFAHTRIFPFLWYWRFGEETTLVIPPLLGLATRPGGWTALAPLFYAQHDEKTTRVVLFPALWWMDEPGWQLRALWPLVGWSRRFDESGRTTRLDVSVAWPFLRYTRDDSRDLAQAWFPWPIASAGIERGDSFAWLFPAFYATSRPGRTHLEVAPAFLLPFGSWLSSGADTFISVGWPFLFSYWTRGERVHSHSPLHWYDGDGKGGFALGPLLHWWSDGKQATWSFLFPLLYGSSRGEGRSSFRFLWEFFAYERNGPENYEWRVLGRFLRYQVHGDETLFEFNPFFRYECKGDRYTYFSLLMGLYAYEREGAEARHRLFGIWL